jgi:hypothetical protein
MSTGLKANVDGSAAIQVGGVDAITLTSAGAASFVTSPMTIQGGSAAAPSLTFSGDTNTGIFSPAADTIAFTEGGVESMRIDASGNLLLGTTTASANFYIYNAPISYAGLNATAIFSSSASQSTGTGGLIAFEGKYTSGGALANFAAIGGLKENSTDNNYSGYLGFYTRSNGSLPAERARIDSSGRFMVGTTGSSSAGINIGNQYGGVNLAGGGGSYANWGGSYGIWPWNNVGLGIGSAAAIGFVVNGGTDAARIDSSGRLIVNGDNGFTNTIKFSAVSDAGGSNGTFMFKNSAGNNQWTGWVWNAGTSGDGLLIQFGTETAFTGRGSITYNRGAGLIAFNTTSDYRTKDIHGPVINALTTINGLKPYMGTMKGATVQRPMFVAHETQEVAPYAVTGEKDALDKDGNPQYQQMDHSTLIPLLTAAIQELKAELDATKAEVALLKGAA